jgi:prevent-host-death family protein
LVIVKLKEPEVIYKSGKPTAVILPLAEYEKLLELAEDAVDVAYLKKARREGMSFRPFSDYVKERTAKETKRRVQGRR